MCSTKDTLSTLKKSIYVKGIEEYNYLTTVHTFDNKLYLTILSLKTNHFIVILHLKQ